MPVRVRSSEGLGRTRVLDKLKLVSSWIEQRGKSAAPSLPLRLGDEVDTLACEFLAEQVNVLHIEGQPSKPTNKDLFVLRRIERYSLHNEIAGLDFEHDVSGFWAPCSNL